MTGAAWTMLAVTWAVILYYTIKFFVMVLQHPPQQEEGQVAGAAEVHDISEHD
ncbi:MAG TPA: hypothetical protein VFV54_02650 [Thermoanaerobaculia bacterium]|nr:hypothetical protein [Thermoanaerobaculia bacterium]